MLKFDTRSENQNPGGGTSVGALGLLPHARHRPAVQLPEVSPRTGDSHVSQQVYALDTKLLK